MFFDDILVYNPILESHVTYLAKVFDCLPKEFFISQTLEMFICPIRNEYVEQIISSRGVEPNQSKFKLRFSSPLTTMV